MAEVDEQEKMVRYIEQKVSELSTNDRDVIYNRIMAKHNVPDEKVSLKGTGVQVKYKYVPPECIEEIYNFIKKVIEYRTERLKAFTVENTEDPPQ